jgi:glycosyltransferase involved in cell wall biosynthesis
MRILAIEPYYKGSHKAFLDGLVDNSTHEIHTVTISERSAKWRMHGDSVRLAEQVMRLPESFDLLFVSSMVNLPAFLALTNPRFAYTPKVVYMHENQITQPIPPGEKRDMTFCYINYLSVLAADHVIFNSQFQKDDFIDHLPSFLNQYSDGDYLYTIDRILKKSQILYPGLELKRFDALPDTRSRNKRLTIVWNQRWQFDRNPGLFFRTLNRLDDIDLEFDLILAGDSKHEKPEEFDRAWKRYRDRIIHFGYVDDFETYSKLLHQGDIVVSTSNYEFFCTPIMEAIYAGCHPVLPNKLHYPELIPDGLKKPLLHGQVLYNDDDELFYVLKKLLGKTDQTLPKSSLQNINKKFDWSIMIRQYDRLFDSIIEDVETN